MHDACHLSLRIAADDPRLGAKLEALAQYGLASPQRFPLKVKMLAPMRIIIDCRYLVMHLLRGDTRMGAKEQRCLMSSLGHAALCVGSNRNRKICLTYITDGDLLHKASALPAGAKQYAAFAEADCQADEVAELAAYLFGQARNHLPPRYF